MPIVIDGKKIAEAMINELKKLPKPDKFLAVFLVGNDESSRDFVKRKEAVAKELGVDFRIYRFPETITKDELRREVGKTAAHKTCGGIVVQLPLPEHIEKNNGRGYVLNAIPREKDPDVLSERALGAFYHKRNPVLPPAVGAIQTILAEIDTNIENATVAVVGAGFLIGKPVTLWLLGKAKEVIVLRSRSDLRLISGADLVISGTGTPYCVKPDVLKRGAGVIDFGYGKADGKTCGDLDTRNPAELSRLSFYTPVPGGTGPILVAELFRNFYTLNGSRAA